MHSSSSDPTSADGRPDRSSAGSRDQTSSIIYGEDYGRWVPSVQGDDLVGADDYHSRKEQGDQLDGRISWRPSQMNAEPFPIDIYPPQFEPGELQEAQARNPTNSHPHGAENDLQSTPGGRNTLRRDIRSMNPRKLASHEITRTGAEIVIVVDLDQGLDGDEGNHWLTRQRCFSEPGPAFGMRDAVVRVDRDTQNTLQTNGNQAWAPDFRTPQFQGRPPHDTPPQPDLSILHHSSKCYVSLCFA